MTTLSEWFHEQEQEEKEEREAKRRANLDEWRRIAKMLRDLEYIKVPVRRERDRGGIMICQYCGHKLTDGKCLNPACPGRLIVHKFSLPDGKLVEIADERIWIYGSFDYLTTDEIDVIHAEIHRNDPDIAEAREKEDREMYEHPNPLSEWKALKPGMKNSVSLKALADNWPSPYVAREEIDRFTGGLLTAKYCANLDSQGRGIRGRIRCGRKIAYPTRSVVEFMESRSSALDND